MLAILALICYSRNAQTVETHSPFKFIKCQQEAKRWTRNRVYWVDLFQDLHFVRGQKRDHEQFSVLVVREPH
jgi:hypothetical protein